MTQSKTQEKLYIGADVSKATIDFFNEETGEFNKIQNDKAALKRFLKTLKGEAIIVFEATGGYERKLSMMLENFPYLERLRVHPSCVKAFARAMGTKAKTDKIDAYMLAKAAKTLKDQFFDTTPPPKVQELRDYLTHQKHLEAALHAEKCREKMDDLSPFVRKETRKNMRSLGKAIERVKTEIMKLIRGDATLNKKYIRLQETVGVGPVIAVSVLAFLPELGKIGRKQIASLAGLAPNTRQSGTKTSRSFTSGGRQILRKALFMGALVGMKYNSVLQQFYARLVKNGRPKMVAIIAAARKLLIHLNALEKKALQKAEMA